MSNDRPAVSFRAADFKLAKLDWTTDERPGVPDNAYREFQLHLCASYPATQVRVIVRRYIGEPRGVALAQVKATFERPRYLAGEALNPSDIRAAEAAAGAMIAEVHTPRLREILIHHRSER